MINLKNHITNKSTYSIEGKKGAWILVYYPILRNGYRGELYEEPRALMQNIDKPGFWSNEMPLRYINKL